MKFECGYCHKEHETIEARTQCELTCAKAKAEEDKKIKEKKLAAEKQSRIEEIQKEFNDIETAKERLASLVVDYCSDYKDSLSLSNGKIVPSKPVKITNFAEFSNFYDYIFKNFYGIR